MKTSVIEYELQVETLSKRFGNRRIFQDVSVHYSQPGIYGISGANGAGKSTFVKIVSGLLSPTRGTARHILNGKQIDLAGLHNNIGFMAPYLMLYDEFTAKENLAYFESIRGVKFDWEQIETYLMELKLGDRQKDFVRGFSSGMKQRLKFIFAIAHNPHILILDEPTSNLDSSGKEIIYGIVKKYSNSHIVLIASNEEADLGLCGSVLRLEDYKAGS